MRRIRYLLPLPALAACTALEGDTGDVGWYACTEEAVGSVNVDVRTVDGASIDPTVTWAVDGGAAQACDAWGDGSYVCGWEVAGDITVVVEAEGYGTQSFVLTVAEDDCHVIPESIEVVLEPAGG